VIGLARSVAIAAAANALSLGLAAWVFDGFDIRFAWFVVAVVLFTVLTVVLRGVVVGTVNRYARGYTIAGGLVLSFLVLLLTEVAVPEDGFSIDGWGTWIGVTLIVWAAGVAFGEVDDAAPAPRRRPARRH
jgi:hypothetical protein